MWTGGGVRRSRPPELQSAGGRNLLHNNTCADFTTIFAVLQIVKW